ncbi:hypothetical protein ACOME3_000440 [Neoechinorhynchus agilis]
MSSTLISSRNIRRPPPYSRLNYAVSRLFDIGYLSNVIKLNVTSTSSSGVKFVTSGKLFMDTQKAIGGLETRFVTADKGFTFSEKWDTDNVLSSELIVNENILSLRGLSLNLQLKLPL